MNRYKLKNNYMMRILSTRNENKYDDKATCGREQAFIIAKREVNSPSP